jgi:hypothetical protein
MAKFYAGIGSRSTPTELEPVIANVAFVCNVQGFTLRSGGAPGADTMFEKDADRKEIFLPWRQFNGNESPLHPPTAEAYKIAATYHPAWSRCSQGARALHARNVHQILGRNLNEPVEFVVCWTPGGEDVGGTSQALRIARAYGIWIENLWRARSQKVWTDLANALREGVK